MTDEQPDGDPHGECAAEIHRLQAENKALREALQGFHDASGSGFRGWHKKFERAIALAEALLLPREAEGLRIMRGIVHDREANDQMLTERATKRTRGSTVGDDQEGRNV